MMTGLTRLNQQIFFVKSNSHNRGRSGFQIILTSTESIMSQSREVKWVVDNVEFNRVMDQCKFKIKFCSKCMRAIPPNEPVAGTIQIGERTEYYCDDCWLQNYCQQCHQYWDHTMVTDCTGCGRRVCHNSKCRPSMIVDMCADCDKIPAPEIDL